MPQALYQKYRPKVWAELTDQRHIKVTLENEIVRNQVAHAYLFVGPRGVGKTTAARLFAKSVNCSNRAAKSAEPCNACPACRRLNTGQSFDIIEIDAASHTGVDHVREHILNSVEVTAGHGRYRVFIIDEVHMLSTAAFNAMLKVLEEPPLHVIFILATTEAHKVPATIISRCQRFDFKRIPADAIRERLRLMCTNEGVTVDEPVLAAVAEHADGSLRDAESMLGQIHALGVTHITMDEASLVLPRSDTGEASALIGQCLDRNAPAALQLVSEVVTNGVSLPVFMNDCMKWLRALLLIRVAERLDDFTDGSVGERRELLLGQAERASVNRLSQMIDIFSARRKVLSDLPLPQMALELAVIESCAGSDSLTPEPSQSSPLPPGLKMTEHSSGPVAKPAGRGFNMSSSSDSNVSLEPSVSAADTPPRSVVEGQSDNKEVLVTVGTDELVGRWSDILEKVKLVNHSLSFVLNSARPLSFEQGTFKIGVPYVFHHDRLLEPKNRALLGEIAAGIFGGRVHVEPVLNEVIAD